MTGTTHLYMKRLEGGTWTLQDHPTDVDRDGYANPLCKNTNWPHTHVTQVRWAKSSLRVYGELCVGCCTAGSCLLYGSL